MQFQFNTDQSVDGHEALGRHAEQVTRKSLERFGQQLTRVELHLSDVNGGKTARNDKQCLMEARIAGRRPIVVRESADTLHQVIDQAAQKMQRRLSSTFGKLTQRRRTAPAPAAVVED